jgi:hypothetical protein
MAMIGEFTIRSIIEEFSPRPGLPPLEYAETLRATVQPPVRLPRCR